MAIKGLNFNIGSISSSKIKGGGLSNAAKFKPSILKLNTDQLKTNVGLIDDIVSLEKRADNVEKMTSSLMETNNILIEIQQQLALDFGNRIVEQNEENKKLEKQSSKEKFKEEEENIEKSRKKSERKLGESAKKVVAPIQGMFSKIFNFVKTITGGIAVDFAFNWLKDDKNKEKLENWFGFIKDHWKWIATGLGVLTVAQIIGPLAGVFNIVTSAFPIIIGAVKLFASPLGLKVLAAIALGILVWKGGEWIVNQIHGGKAYAQAINRLEKQLKETTNINKRGERVTRQGPGNLGDLVRVKMFKSGPYAGQYYLADQGEGGRYMTLSIGNKIRNKDGSLVISEEDTAAFRKLEADYEKVESIKNDQREEVKNYNKKRNEEKKEMLKGINDQKIENELKIEFDRETQKGINNIKLKYANKIYQTFPNLFSKEINQQKKNLELKNLIDDKTNTYKKVSSEGTISYIDVPGTVTETGTLTSGSVATQVSIFSPKNNGDPYRSITPSIYGIFV